MRRKDREVTNLDEICKIMDRCEACCLAMNQSGNYPYIVPVNYGYRRDGAQIYLYVHGANAGTKKELLQQDARVSFEMHVNKAVSIGETACNSTMDFESVCGTGDARFLGDEEKLSALQMVMKQYTDKDLAFEPAMLEHVMVIEIAVKELTGKVHGVMPV